MHIDENPVAAGSYDDTFRDEPDIEITCPHCGARWERYIVTSDGSLFDWNQVNGMQHTYLTHDNGHTPICNDYCYACAKERANAEDYIEFVDDNYTDEFRSWLIGL